jgi:hypothetical protein
MEDNTSIGGRSYADASDSGALHGGQGKTWGCGDFLTVLTCHSFSQDQLKSINDQSWHKFLGVTSKKVVEIDPA